MLTDLALHGKYINSLSSTVDLFDYSYFIHGTSVCTDTSQHTLSQKFPTSPNSIATKTK